MKRLVCKNPWCKAQFTCQDDKIKEVDGKKIYPRQCKKCQSFDNELSGGVSWEDREYEGNPWVGSQEIKYNITKYR